ncbi:recombinase family protein [Paraburkholderia sp. BL10I2N1]|uniref:recombinase family protein n=1 Tax=Paraburkholderia sp. BL10I2N1 TaxID=1938796 RepID=UPI0010CDF83F|nr:recombinase family protein [Paraburkholderia sp. BL10I2N1]TDN62171.1 DNA invertase Pin-like site-specific DNA recombinase [Paraburkholderia sp. BL10I2N1]
MRVAVYTRVSTPDQSTDRQRRELRNYAKARGWKIVREMQETVSGASQKRPLREEVMQLARTRAVDVILVQALDRWGRSVQDLILTMAELEALGVAFVVPGQIDMSTPVGRMHAHLLSAIAEFERELIRERVRSGLANARARGKHLGPPNATPRLVNKGLTLIRQGMTYPQAAEQSGVSISTLLRARRKGKAA